jgi:cytochrome-b5 reductase
MAAMRRCAAGIAAAAGLKASSVRQHSACDSPTSFSPKEFRKFPVDSVKQVNHNTKLIRLRLDSPEHTIGMSVASLVSVNGIDEETNEKQARPYTPISTNEDKGYCDLLIKVYPLGIVSKYLGSVKPGDEVEIKGPFKKIAYKPNMKRHIGMIAGGSGVTPMLQLMREIARNPADRTEVTFLFANVGTEDILLRDELDSLAAASQGRIKIRYIVETPTQDKGIFAVGRATPELIRSVMPAPAEDVLVCVCGPNKMLEVVCGGKVFEQGKAPKQGPVAGFLRDCGYSEEMVYKF